MDEIKDELIKDEINEELIDEKREKLRKDILVRLRRIEGQVKGIHGMIEKNVCCPDVLVQITAIRAAINKVGGMIIEDYARNCMGVPHDSEAEEGLEQLVKTINTFMK